MNLQVTKKVASQFKLGLLPDPPELVQLYYCWRVKTNLEDGHNFLTFMNDATRYVVFVNNPDTKLDLETHLFENLRHVLLAENVNPDVIDLYFEVGEKVCLFRNADWMERSWLTHASTRVKTALRFTSENVLVSRLASGWSVPPDKRFDEKERFYPNERFISAMDGFDPPLYLGQALDLKATLNLEDREIVRRLRVSANITFFGLHNILLSAFGWEAVNRHSFSLHSQWPAGDDSRPDLLLVSAENPADKSFNRELAPPKPADSLSEAEVKLTEHLPKFSKIIYAHDFGAQAFGTPSFKERRSVKVEVEDALDNCPGKLPILLAGEGDSPGELVKSRRRKSKTWLPFDFESSAWDVKRLVVY